jgi:hypothetical protein
LKYHTIPNTESAKPTHPITTRPIGCIPPILCFSYRMRLGAPERWAAPGNVPWCARVGGLVPGGGGAVRAVRDE